MKHHLRRPTVPPHCTSATVLIAFGIVLASHCITCNHTVVFDIDCMVTLGQEETWHWETLEFSKVSAPCLYASAALYLTHQNVVKVV